MKSTCILSVWTKSESATPTQNKTKSHDQGHLYIEYFDSWSYYKIWNTAGHELQTSVPCTNMYLDILPTKYHEKLMAKTIFSISLLTFFPVISFKSSSVEEEH